MRVDLNEMRKQALEHVESLWEPCYVGGGFKGKHDSYVSIMGTTDAAWIFYMLQAEEQINKYGGRAASWLNAQAGERGMFIHDTPCLGGKGYRHSHGHAFWMTVRALSIYGQKLENFPEYLKDYWTPEQLNQWFAQSNWQSPESNHHNVLGLIPTMVSQNNPEWVETFYRNLADQQDPLTATWCDNTDHKTNVSRTFAYCAMHMAAGRIPPRAEELVSTILKIQRDIGIWETKCDFPEYHTMDATYIVSRVGDAIGYPEAPRKEALLRTAHAMNAYFASRPICRFEGLHLLQANLHTLGLLQEALPELYSTEMPWRFDWDKADMFYCPVIAEQK